LTSYSFTSTIEFWNTQRKGTNYFNKVPTEAWFREASDLGVEWVRLTYDKWSSAHRDFLIGDASNYHGLVEEDLDKLEQVIQWAEKYDIKLVITPLSLPGSRYRQNNDFQWDTRLWDSYEYWEQSIRFWTDLVSQLKDHTNIVAYNIINEPCPEFGTGIEEHIRPGEVSRFLEWYDEIQDTPRDLFQFYKKIISAILKIDPDAVMMLDAGWYGQPGAFCYWPETFDGNNILYAFHMYEPYEFTSNKNYKEKNNYVYPGNVPFGNDTIYWGKNTIEAYFKPFLNWVKLQGISPSRIVAGEFGCMRKNEGASEYLRDLIDFLNRNRFHWAFYSFREDEWDGYDYELGTEPLSWKYWQARERGENPSLPRMDNPLFEILKQEFDYIK
jgi:hypothetical protein